MSQLSPKIIFFGTEEYSLSTLETLVNHGFNVVAVVTKPDSKSGRGHKLNQPPVKIFAKAKQIDVWQPRKIEDIIDKIKPLQPVVGVLVAYGKIIPQNIIDLFTPGIINIHPSILPRWRGPSPIEATIASRDTQAGVTIMQLDAGMDSGPIYAQSVINLRGNETKPELYQTLFDLGNKLLVEHLIDIYNSQLQPTPQNEKQSTFCQMLSKKNSLLDPTNITATDAEAQVRAHLEFPRTRIQIDKLSIIITRAYVSRTPKTTLRVRCKDGNYLIIDELIAPSGKTMLAENFARGYLKNPPTN